MDTTTASTPHQQSSGGGAWSRSTPAVPPKVASIGPRPASNSSIHGLEGTEYEIDLNKKNAAALRKQLALFVDHARKAGRGQRRPVRPASRRERGGDIRAWAKEQGITVSDRGRIPASVVEQYEAVTEGQ